jgi:hypothetical protein
MSKNKRILAPEASQHLKDTQIIDGEPQASPGDQTSVSHEAALRKLELRKTFVTISDQIAESTFLYRNWKWDNGNRLFPKDDDALLRFVTKHYPYAKGGPLYFDETQTAADVARCERKRAVMRSLGLRYIVAGLDTSYEDAYAQLDPLFGEEKAG